MKMGKMLMVFLPPYGLNNEYGGNFKVGCPPVNCGSKREKPPRRPRFLCFCDPAQALWGVPEELPLL